MTRGTSLGKVFRIAMAVVVVALAVAFAWKQDWHAVFAATRNANPAWLALATTLNLPLVWCKARRSQLLLAPTVKLPIRQLMRMFFASYAADNLFMSHAGVGLRVAMVRRAGAPWATAAALQALEKALEAMGIALLALVVQLGPPAGVATWPSWIARPLAVCFWLAAGAAVLALALVAAAVAGRIGPAGASLLERRLSFVRRMGDAAVALRRPRVALEVAVVTAAAWGVEVMMVSLTLRALALPSSVSLAALVVLAVTVAALIPGLPANLGPFEASAILALEAGGVAKPAALGMVLVYHLLHTLPVTLVGLPDLRKAGFRRDEEPPAQDGAASAVETASG